MAPLKKRNTGLLYMASIPSEATIGRRGTSFSLPLVPRSRCLGISIFNHPGNSHIGLIGLCPSHVFSVIIQTDLGN